MDTQKKNVYIIDTNNPQSLQGLKDVFKDVLREINEVEKKEDEYLSQSEAIKFLKISEPTFIKLRDSYPISYIMRGRQKFYSKSLLNKVDTNKKENLR